MKIHEEPTWNHKKTMKTDLEPWKTNLEPWKTIKTHLELWKTSLELNQIGWTTLFKNFCNNTSVFLQIHFAFSINTEAQRNTFDPKTLRDEHGAFKKVMIFHGGPNWPSEHGPFKKVIIFRHFKSDIP